LKPLRLSVVLLGDRLAVAALHGSRIETFMVEAESPGMALRAELESRRLPARAAFLALSRAAVSVKPIELPAVAGDVRQMVGFELERHLPFPADDASYDFLPLPAEPAGDRPTPPEQRVLVTAADRRVVDTTLRLAEEAGLRPLSLTVASHNLPSLARLPRDARVAWIHRAGGATEILLLDGPTLMLSRSLPGIDEALIADELRRSVTVVRWRGCDAVWISGDDDAAGIADSGALAGLGVPVTEPAWNKSAVRRLQAVGDEQRGALQLALAVASGRHVRQLELLPSTVRPRRLSRSQVFTVGMATAVGALGLIALLAPGWREQSRLTRLNAEIARLEPDVKNVERLLREVERKRKLLATVDAAEAAGVRPLPALRDLTELLPPDAWLTTVSFDPKGVELTGAAAAASALIPLLENSPRFERVEFSSPVTRGRDSKEQFRIRASWEGTGAVATAAGGPAQAGAPVPPAVAPPAPAPAGVAPATAPPTPPPATTPGSAPPTRRSTPPTPGTR
jgi:Tfp pilus assembly protein PilN